MAAISHVHICLHQPLPVLVTSYWFLPFGPSTPSWHNYVTAPKYCLINSCPRNKLHKWDQPNLLKCFNFYLFCILYILAIWSPYNCGNTGLSSVHYLSTYTRTFKCSWWTVWTMYFGRTCIWWIHVFVSYTKLKRRPWIWRMSTCDGVSGCYT